MVAEVVRLLEARLGEPLIVRWLAEGDKSVGPLTAGDLVTLKKAGASDELVAVLLDRSRAGTAAGSPAPAAATSRPVATAPPSPPAPPPAVDAAKVDVLVSLRYIHVPEEGEPWDLVVYLDGTPFEPLPAAPSAASAGTWTYQRSLAPGHHILSWSQELHRQDGEGHAQHAARFDPEPLPFELAAGSSAAIELEYRDRTGMFLRMGGPVTVRVSQQGRELASRNSSGDPAAWPQLCEEIEANLGSRKPGFLERQELRSCLRWAELWRSVPNFPGRDTVRPAVR